MSNRVSDRVDKYSDGSAPGRQAIALTLTLLLNACAANLPTPDSAAPGAGHLQPPPASSDSSIPAIVEPTPLVPPPQAQPEPVLYTVVAQDIPLRDLLFTLARDYGINVDVHPGIDGIVTINAIDQSMQQILERLARQSDIRWSMDAAGNLVVEPDRPEWRTYRVDYVNVGRSGTTEATVSTAIISGVAGGAGGGAAAGGPNNSTSSMTQTFENNFWTTLAANLSALVSGSADAAATGSVISNPETGLISVLATQRQHQRVAAFIDEVQTRSLHQVLIEATVVEVSLNDDFQSGVDWTMVGRDGGTLTLNQSSLAGNLASQPFNLLTLDRSDSPDAITATMRLLSQFGELRVLSSPRVMALNNQSAMLRVVDNEVYFTVEVEPGVVSNGVASTSTYTTTVHTVPVGFVMTVTPQIGDGEQITLNVRPTISRIVDYAIDPNPILAEAGVEPNQIPKIQVREFDSILKVFDGQVAILGGLMEDSVRNDSNGLPGLSRLGGLRNLFGYRQEVMRKTELIIFIRPVVIRQPSLNGDLREYRQYLPTGGLESSAVLTPGQLLPGRAAE